MVTSITRTVSKSITNDNSGIKFTFWKTNFNMPVGNVFGDLTNWNQFDPPVTLGGAATSFSLSGFSPGFETVLFTALYDWTNDSGSPVTIHEYLYSKWVDTDNSTTLVTGANGIYHAPTIAASGGWAEYIYSVNIGVAGWEIDANGTYYVKAHTTGDYAISEVSTSITFSNVPSTATVSGKAGYIWVEGNNLCFINANEYKHTIVGTLVSTSPGTDYKGYMWIDTSNDLHWIGDNGYDYKPSWKIKQFASYFTNSATHEQNAGTSKKGYLWMDSEFGWTHLGYIGNDGYKYLTGSGDDPYA